MLHKIDFLSPPITLFHLERRTHTSKIGAILVIALLIICFSYILFLLVNLITHKQMTYIFHKKFEYEAGHYSFNSSSIFHFIQIFSSDDGGYFDKFDSRYIRAYTTYEHSNLTYDNLYLFDHWVFDQCRQNMDDKGLDQILFTNVENFTNAVCIRYYYNSSQKKYFTLEDKGFKWPYLEHGTAQRSNIYLTTIVQKCSNDSVLNQIFGKCPSQKEIDDYLNKYFGIYLYFTDTQVDPTEYINPVTKYLQVVSTGIGTEQTYVESYIHFSPVRVITTIGSIFGESYDFNSFYFDFNRKGTANNLGQKYFTITRYYHLMQNNVQIYERRYNNIFDLFSEIGGVIQFTFYFFYWINFVYNQFVIDNDTNSLFFSIKEDKSKNKRNSNLNLNSIPSTIKLNGNDNNIFHIQNNLLKLSKNDVKKYRKSFCYIRPNQKNEINDNFKNKDITIKKRSAKFNNDLIYSNQNEKYKNKNMNDDKTITAYNINADKSQAAILDNLGNRKGIDLSRRPKSSNRLSIRGNKNISNKAKVKLNENSIKKEKEKNKKYYKKIPKDIMTNINISRLSINNFNYDNIITFKKLKTVSILGYTKSRLFKKEKTNYRYITLFRKHLLSEEHLVKSHITTVLLEKKYNINNDETTNFFECYDKL